MLEKPASIHRIYCQAMMKSEQVHLLECCSGM